MIHFPSKTMILFVLIITLALTGTALAATFATRVSGPEWLNPGYRFYADSNTAWGESTCVELHPKNPEQGYHRYQCSYYSDQGGGTYRWQCNTDTNYPNNTIEYQFFVCDSGTNCQTNCEAWSGFNWQFNTGPTAITLRALAAAPALPAALPVAGVIVALGGLGGLVAWRRRRG